MTIKRVAVYDMDGTIVCSLHRYRTMLGDDGIEHIDLAHWRANQHKAYDDSLLPLAQQYKDDLQDPSCYVVIATARVLNEPDMRFINDKLGKPDYIISRPANSNISGGMLKVNGLRKFRNLQNFKDAAWIFYEDNRAYLEYVCTTLGISGILINSRQGH